MKREDQEFLSGMMDGEWQALDVRRAIADVCADEALREKWSRYHLARHAMRREAVVPGGSLAERIGRAVADEPTYSNVTAIAAFAADITVDAPPARPGADGIGDERAATAVPIEAATSASAPARTTVSATSRDAAANRSVVSPPASRAATARTFTAGFGLAASVAVVTAFGLNALQGGEGGVPGSTEARVADATAVEPGSLVVASGAGASTGNDVAGPFVGQAPGVTLPAVELVSNTSPLGAYWTSPDSSARRAGSEARLNMFLSQHIENSPTAERQGMLPYSRLVGYDERAAVGR